MLKRINSLVVLFGISVLLLLQKSAEKRGILKIFQHFCVSLQFAAVDIFLHCAEKLEEMRDLERKEDMFTPVPSPYYMELTKLLLNQ